MLHQNPGHCKHWQTQFNAGQAAFKAGKLPCREWPEAKRAGWEFAGEAAYFHALADEAEERQQGAEATAEYLPLSDEPGYSESLTPFLW